MKKFTIKKFEFHKFLALLILLSSSGYLKAQDCTVNAGIDRSYCFSQGNLGLYSGNPFLFQLVGNSSGNLNATPNLLWELVSAPPGANISLTTPNNNATYVSAAYKDIPTGVYTFRLGVDCLTGGRVFDNVQVTITNVADFQLLANKKFSDLCGNLDDSVKLIGRPLKAGETLTINGTVLNLTSTNANPFFGTSFNGPTADSVRFTVNYNDFNNCKSNQSARFTFQITNGSCGNYGGEPIADSNATKMGNLKPFVSKTAIKRTDTIAACFNPAFGASFSLENICVKGGLLAFNNYVGSNISVVNLTGSGNIVLGVTATGYKYDVYNNWDTVTNNTLNTFEITYNSNGCFPTFKDTFKVFFKSSVPSLSTFTFANLYGSGAAVSFCEPDPFPKSTYGFKLIKSGTVPAQYKFNSIFLVKPSAANISNPQGMDSLIFSGTIMPGLYRISTTITDTISGCSVDYITDLNILQRLQLPVLRDTSICYSDISYSFDIPYPTGTFGAYQYNAEVINQPYYVQAYQDNITIYATDGFVGDFDIRVFPNTSNFNACTDGRADTFHILIKSGGYKGNAGTDQALQCNVSTTNLAGSNPVSNGGTEGFWKFLPAISTNGGTPIVIADTADISTTVSGFINQSAYYFSWNVTAGNTGNYCSLKPDTVRIIFSGTPPGNAQAAQADFTGCLPPTNKYTLTSNAVTPNFGVKWSQISGSSSTIATSDSTNTDVTSLTTGTYKYEVAVSNACSIFKDTVTLNFPSVCGTVPVKLISFIGTQDINGDILNWVVSDESNIKKYVVEISQDGIKFSGLKDILPTVYSSGNKTYTTTNNNVTEYLNYYRLKIVQNDGSFDYSSIIKLTKKDLQKDFVQISPMPAKSKLYLTINSLSNASYNIQISDVSGRTVIKKYINVVKGKNTVQFDVNTLPRGFYQLKIGDISRKIILD